MESIYLLIFLICCLIEDNDNVLLKKTDINAFKDEKILHVSEEPSLLQCAQRCKFIDKNAIVDFKNAKCTCVKYEVAEGQEHQGTLTGVFVSQKLMKAKKVDPAQSNKPPQSTKPTVTSVINIALNKTAQQSTTYSNKPGNVANMAIDGLESTLSHTEYEPNAWWSIDLKTTTDIMYMVLKGRVGSSWNQALIVETLQEDKGAWETCKDIGDLQTKPSNFTCDKPTNARFVKIRSTAYCFIWIDEFEVYARVGV